MRKMLLLSGFLLALKILPAQTSKFSLAIGVGANQPVGAFGSKNVNQQDAGLAKTGLSANITATYMVTKTFGLTALLGVQDNGVDTKTIEGNIKESAKDPASTYVNITARHWQAAKVLAGGTIVLPLGGATGKWQFTGRLLGGVFKTRIPQQSVVVGSTGTDLGSTFYWSAKRSKISLPLTFAASGGAGVQYNVSKKIFLLGSIDYNYAAPQSKYPNNWQFGAGVSGGVITTPIPPPVNPPVFRQGMCSVSLTAGAGIKL